MDTVLQSRTLDSKPIAPSLFAHFVLRSSNMPAMVDWYSTVLNMHVVQRNDFICFLTYDNEHHRHVGGAQHEMREQRRRDRLLIEGA